MEEAHAKEQFLIEWASLLSDPGSIESLVDQGTLCYPGYPVPVRLALWLEYFLMAGEEAFKKKWLLLSPEEQRTLGIELLKCYLVQPLFLRVSGKGRPATAKAPFNLKKEGKLLQVTLETGTEQNVLIFYPLVHRRLWPGLLLVFKEVFFYSDRILKTLESELGLAAASRLGEFRQRAETLDALFSKRPESEIFHLHKPKVESDSIEEKEAPFMMEEALVQDSGGVGPSKAIETVPPALSVPDSGVVVPMTLKKKKKSKSSEDQMKLF